MKFQAIKGVRDILPAESALWNRVEQTAREVFATYGYGEIRLPIFEQTELFARSIGVETDVVSKEMYTFADRDDSSISLRPEATASACRAFIEHGMHTLPGNVKLYYIGPMFRRERPQKGRYRQFYQIGAEVLGQSDAPAIDAEVIEMLLAFFERVGLGGSQKSEVGGQKSEIRNQKSETADSAALILRLRSGQERAATGGDAEGVTLYINSIGCKECRPKYVEKLRAALVEHINELKADSQRRVETNPLRVLDSKLPEEQAVIEKLPRITDHLCAACREHYAEVKKQLALRGVSFVENWRLVRGLDYYMRTTFEITAPNLGAQNAVCGGGRYDGLVELLGGPATKGIGFAIGTDRLILSLQERAQHAAPLRNKAETQKLDVFIAWMGAASQPAAVKMARTLREAGFSVEVPAEEMKFKKSIGLADKLGARFALIIGENELKEGKYALKRLSDGVQEKVGAEELAEKVKEN